MGHAGAWYPCEKKGTTDQLWRSALLPLPPVPVTVAAAAAAPATAASAAAVAAAAAAAAAAVAAVATVATAATSGGSSLVRGSAASGRGCRRELGPCAVLLPEPRHHLVPLLERTRQRHKVRQASE